MKLSMISEFKLQDLLKMSGMRSPKRYDTDTFDHGRSGNQNTPLKPRHKKFFNAPDAAAEKKEGFGIRTTDYRPQPAKVDDTNSSMGFPKSAEDGFLAKMRKTFRGNLPSTQLPGTSSSSSPSV